MTMRGEWSLIKKGNKKGVAVQYTIPTVLSLHSFALFLDFAILICTSLFFAAFPCTNSLDEKERRCSNSNVIKQKESEREREREGRSVWEIER